MRYIKLHGANTIYWMVFSYTFINDINHYKMADNNFVVQSIKCYEFCKNWLKQSIVHKTQWNRIFLYITRKFTYIKENESKQGSCSSYLNLTATKALVNQLQLAYQLAKKPQNNQGVEIYNIFCLISNISYSFLHKSTASDCKRLGRLSSRGHNCRLRYRSLEYR